MILITKLQVNTLITSLPYNNNESINKLFKKILLSQYLKQFILKKILNPKTPSKCDTWKELRQLYIIKSADIDSFGSMRDVQNSSNIMLKKFYISCFYVVLLYVKKIL